MLIQSQKQKEFSKCEKPEKQDAPGKEINIDPKTYCKLGHFHLLLEDYAKGKHSMFPKIFFYYTILLTIPLLFSYVCLSKVLFSQI